MHAADEDSELLRLQLEGEELERKAREEDKSEYERDNRGVPIKKDKDGTVFEWDESMKGWFPKVDAAFLAAYSLSYGESGAVDSEQTNLNDEKTNVEETAKLASTNQSHDNVRYVDPETRNVYEWNAEKYLWINTKDASDTMAPNVERNSISNPQKYSDPASGVVYVWSPSNYQWVAEKYQDPATGTEYSWNENESKYLPPGGLEDDNESDEDETEDNVPSSDANNSTSDNSKNGGSEKEEAKNPEASKEKETPQQKAKRKRKEPEWFNIEENQNSNVYVHGLPLDTTSEEFEELMSKYGIIMTDPDTGKPKIKLYLNPDGTVKGDGRCCYLKIESVDLALKLLDGLDYRGGNKIGVQKAHFQLKGDFDPTLKKKKKNNKKKKGKASQEKLLDWRPEANRLTVTKKRCEKVAVLKNVFNAKEMMKDLKQATELQKSVNQACLRFGAIKKVCVFDLHEEGVVSIAFRDWDSADQCVSQLNNRQFLGRKITAEIWDGVTNYKIVESEEQEQARIERWEKELSSNNDGVNSAETEPEIGEGSAADLKPKKPNTGSSLNEMLGLDEADDLDYNLEVSNEEDEQKMRELLANLASGGETFGSVKPKPKNDSPD
ncbi:uncharacterized protein LOC142339053 [Convolutriloba macropyga]|uniref:uncharacterized protein LOC142339053 n=1 Tax=Convolutriloba macropyga TaxID=536237 RepID=UPI003F51EDC6